MNVWFHSGDFGDCIAALPTVRHLGGGVMVLGKKDGRWGRHPMTRERFDVIAPLIQAQEYIADVIFESDDHPPVTHDFHDFRTKAQPSSDGCGVLRYNLATWQAHWFGIKPEDLDLSPWLEATPNNNASWHFSVVSRSLRYQNPDFDWKGILTKHSPSLFLGLPEEYANFTQHGCRVDYHPTNDLFEVAGLILGSNRFIGNQSAPCWIALGLGHPLIQEMDTDIANRNSVIERDNAKYEP